MNIFLRKLAKSNNLSKVQLLFRAIALESAARRLAESRNRAPAAPAGTYGTYGTFGTGEGGWSR